MSFKSLVLLSIGILLVALGCSIISPPLFGLATGATVDITQSSALSINSNSNRKIPYA